MLYSMPRPWNYYPTMLNMFKIFLSRWAPCLCAFVALAVGVQAVASPRVVATIAPVHSLVSSVMLGVGEPSLLLPPNASPHSYNLKPSQAAALAEADLVVWIGPELESFLTHRLSKGKNTQQLRLSKATGVRAYAMREHRDFAVEHAHEHHDAHEHEHNEAHTDKHEHSSHEDAHHDEHEHSDHDDEHHDEHEHSDHDDVHHDEHGHSSHDEHDHGGMDPHLWLSPENARAMLAAIAARLGALDPTHSERYAANAARAAEDLKRLEADIRDRLAPYGDAGFVVFHDAYQYFERSFGLTTSGVISLNPHTPPSAARVARIRNAIQQGSIDCLFSEPQFPQRVVKRLADGLNVRVAQLDPIGNKLRQGSELYTLLLKNMAQSFARCLGD